MIVPALIYVAFNLEGGAPSGWGIPMATDIAFALGVLSLLSRRVPFSLKIFLLALAIADDIGAILVIAVFYSDSVDAGSLVLAVFILLAIVVMNRLGVRSLTAYLAAGALLWLAVFESGVHATLAGVVLGLLAPASARYSLSDFPAGADQLLRRFRGLQEGGEDDELPGVLAQMEELIEGSEPPLERLERLLHGWVSYLIVPLFALANAGVVISSDSVQAALESPVSQGVAVGLVLGKPIGIVTFAWLTVRLGLCELPRGASWLQILGVGLLGGIGFTISLLISGLAFDDPALVDEAKLAILGASVVSAVAGLALLWSISSRRSPP
jgi:NhaA family Na+:H+ antiporter